MVRVKGTFREETTSEGGTRLPRAVFPATMDAATSVILNPQQIQCSTCGLVMRRSNLARHMNSKHPAEMDSSSQELSSSQSSVDSTTNSPKSLASPVAASRGPRGKSPVPGDVPEDVDRKRLKLTIKLPAVAKALKGQDFEDGRFEHSIHSPGQPSDHLPPMPKNSEELMRGLAELYSRRVTSNSKTLISYNDTCVVTRIARDVDKREELQGLMEAMGLKLMAKEDLERLAKEAEERGRRAASEPSDAGVTRGTQTEEEKCPPLKCVTTYQDGSPHVVAVHAGGPWGIKVTPYKILGQI